MAYAVYSTTAAAPLLFLALRKIAMTPRARLQTGYRIEPSVDDCYTPAVACDRAHLLPHEQIKGLRPLGNAMYLDRLLAGGIVGDGLPLANLQIYLDQCQPLGSELDVTA